MSAGKVASRTPICQRFGRWLKNNPAEATKYSNTVGNTAKEQCRKEWSQTTYDAYKKGMNIERSMVKAELEWGSYEPFEVIVKTSPASS
eukprot:7651370-Alexandrium_andersonii.AAC.1